MKPIHKWNESIGWRISSWLIELWVVFGFPSRCPLASSIDCANQITELIGYWLAPATKQTNPTNQSLMKEQFNLIQRQFKSFLLFKQTNKERKRLLNDWVEWPASRITKQCRIMKSETLQWRQQSTNQHSTSLSLERKRKVSFLIEELTVIILIIGMNNTLLFD